jgi:hypothetical protein
MKTEFTKGNWIIFAGKSKEFHIFVEKGGSLDFIYHRVATIFETSRAKREANAKLIAAAPELLKALDCIKSVIDICANANDDVLSNERASVYKSIQKSDTYKLIEKAIKKATE